MPRPISIWLPEGPDRWVRPPRSPLGDHFAARRTLERHRPAGRRRVCWFGESAAAGYLYAPHLTPAGRLEEILRATGDGDGDGDGDGGGGTERWEVVDLARTDERLGSLVATVEAARQLEPDLLAIYAGNNWPLLETPEISPYPPSVAGRQRAAEALVQAGPAGLAGLGRRTLHQRATAALDRIAELARSAGPDGRAVPVVLVLPEVDLADWESRQPVVWLPGDGSRRWWQLHREAIDALARQDADSADIAERAAWEMVRLDGATGPVPYRLLARAWALRGDTDAVRDALQAEVDAVRYPLLAFLDSPRATTDARTLLADAARRHGWASVDLRTVFSRHTGGEIPGRRLFLDYCHLSSEGIDVAMAAVAGRVLECLDTDAGDPEAARRDLADSLVTPESQATARLGAAVHTAHRMLPVACRQALLEHWGRTALDAAPSVADAFVDLADARTADLPALSSAAQGRSLAGPHTLELQHGWRWDGLDAPVLDAMATVLDERDDPRAREIRRLLVERLALGPGERRQLVTPRFRAEPLERFYPEVQNLAGLPGRATDRHPWPESSYLLATDGANAVHLRATVRLPAIPGAAERRGQANLLVDGREVARREIGERWCRIESTVPADSLAPGLHRVTLAWPELPAAGNAAIAAILRRLDEGLEADLHPIFGELASLTATTV